MRTMLSKSISLWHALMLIAVCCVFTLGCSSSQHSTNGTTYSWNGAGATVQVAEDEYHIHMPTSFPAGNEVFHVTNTGEHNHNFKISGNGITAQLSTDILPGMSEDLTVTLQPGTYHVICPMLGHSDLGMRLDVTVTQPTASMYNTR